MQHSLWNMYSNIKNGLMANKKSVIHPTKFICYETLKILYKEGYINGFRILPENNKKIEIFLKYSNGKPVIQKLVSVSKPGRRLYLPVSSLWKLKTSLQTFILSTSRGILSDKECRKYHIGGEVLCYIQ